MQVIAPQSRRSRGNTPHAGTVSSRDDERSWNGWVRPKSWRNLLLAHTSGPILKSPPLKTIGGGMKSVEKLIEEHVKRWQLLGQKPKEQQLPVSVVTLSREPGSGGMLVAKRLAEICDFDLYHKEVIDEIAKNANISRRLMDTLDERGLNVINEYISAIVHRAHLWPDEYLRQMMRVISTIAKHGQAVIVGRGANFVLPPEKRLRVRVVAPREFRVKKVAKDHGISEKEALSRIIRTGSDRKAFIRKYFNADISDPLNYDMIINTGTMSVEKAARMIAEAISS
jgi:cytidylate kinase